MQKKILLITYHFPPSQAVGGLRIFNLAKHLPEYKWQTEVLTIRPNHIKKLNYKRLNEIPETKIHQTTCLPTIRDFYIKLKSIYCSLIEMRYLTPEDLQKNYIPDQPSSNGENLLGQLKRLLISIFLTLPDGERGWILPAVVKGYHLLKKNQYDFILTSCPPYSVHIIGLILKMMTGVPWVADFRDPWYKGSHKKLYVTTSTSKLIEEKLETEVLEKADLILTTTQKLCDIFTTSMEQHRKPSKQKCFCQTNAFDEQLMARIQTKGKYDPFTITYTGSLYYGRTPEPVFNAVSQMIAAKEVDCDQIRIMLVGHCDRIENIETNTVIEKYGLNGIVQLIKPVPYEESVRMIKKSHLALLLAPDQPLQIPAKVFDYIGAGTPILAITQKGATYDLMQYTGTGRAFDPSDINGIKEFIKSAMMNNQALDSSIPTDIMQRFTSKSLAANVAKNLNLCIQTD